MGFDVIMSFFTQAENTLLHFFCLVFFSLFFCFFPRSSEGKLHCSVMTRTRHNGLYFLCGGRSEGAHPVSLSSHWPATRPGRVATQLSAAAVTEHSERLTLGVISQAERRWRWRRHEACSIIHLINVSRRLMNIHTFHLSDSRGGRKRLKG